MTCIPRAKMPQIDLENLPELFAYLQQHRVPVNFAYTPTGVLYPKQCLKQTVPIHDMQVLEKPLLVSNDFAILDGNRRWATYRASGVSIVPCYVIGCAFHHALPILRKFPKTYAYGDGQFHPISY